MQKTPNSIELATYQAFIDNVYSYRRQTHDLVHLISQVAFIFQYDDSNLRFNNPHSIERLQKLSRQYQVSYIDDQNELQYLTPTVLDTIFVQMMQLANISTQYQYIHVPTITKPINRLMDIKEQTRRSLKQSAYQAIDQHRLTYQQVIESIINFVGYDDEPYLHQKELPTQNEHLTNSFANQHPYFDLDYYLSHPEAFNQLAQQDQLLDTDQYLMAHWLIKNS